jgi:hypothetical protein
MKQIVSLISSLACSFVVHRKPTDFFYVHFISCHLAENVDYI